VFSFFEPFHPHLHSKFVKTKIKKIVKNYMRIKNAEFDAMGSAWTVW